MKIAQRSRKRFAKISGEAAGSVNYACPQRKRQ